MSEEENKNEEENHEESGAEGSGEESSEEEKSEPSFEEKQAAKEEKESVKEDTEEVLKLVFALAKVVKQAKSNDGQFAANDLVLLTQLFPHVGPAFDELGDVPKELKDLDAEEAKRLLVVSAAHLGDAVDSKELAEKVEKGLAAALALLDFVKVL